MPILGLALGHSLADTLGSSARWLGGGLPRAGLYRLVSGLRRSEDEPAAPTGLSTGRLVLTGASLGIDNLVIGFALGASTCRSWWPPCSSG